jgi:Trk K+ transport system NAD-binding subunit
MVGRMLRDLDIRKIFGLNIAYIGRMTEEGRKYRIPRPDDVFREDDHIFIMGTQEDIKRYLQS